MVGADWIGWIGFDRIGLIGLGWIGSIGFDLIGLDWIGMGWIGLAASGCVGYEVGPPWWAPRLIMLR